MPLHTRALTPDDAALWRKLRLEGIERYPSAFLSTLQEARDVSKQADISALGRGGRFGLFEDAEMIGLAALRQFAASRTRHRGEIGPFYLRPENQGSGAADLLMRALEDHATRRGIWQLELSLASDNPRARAFYERCGFRLAGRIPNAVLMPDGPLDDLFMVRQLHR